MRMGPVNVDDLLLDNCECQKGTVRGVHQPGIPLGCETCHEVLLQMFLRLSHIGGMYEHSSVSMMLLLRTDGRFQLVPRVLKMERNWMLFRILCRKYPAGMSSTEEACANSVTKMRTTAAEALSSLGDSWDDIVSATCASLQPSVGTSRYLADDGSKLCSSWTLSLIFDD